MPSAKCPECEEDVHVDSDLDIDDLVECDECGVTLTIIGLDPVELDVDEGGDPNGYDDEDEF